MSNIYYYRWPIGHFMLQKPGARVLPILTRGLCQVVLYPAQIYVNLYLIVAQEL